MPMADVDGVVLHYRLDGPEDAPVLLLSNSLGATLDMWLPQLDAFTRHFRVLRYDSRGHGQSAVPPGPYGMDQLTDDVVGLLDAVGVGRVHYCGLSMGGMVGQALALRAPERLDRLVLCNTAALIGPPELWDSRVAAVAAGGTAVLVSVLDRWFTAEFRQRFPDRVEPFAKMLRETNPLGYIACCRAVQNHDLRFSLSAIRAPTLVVAGTGDVATPPAAGRFLVEAIPGAEYLELPAAHLSNVEAADAFTTNVSAFLNG
jgi:3-oxoadipate enol-lactonase